MKTYLIKSDTNFDLMVHVVNADSEKEAINIALNHEAKNESGAWEGCVAVEINTQKHGVVAFA